MCVDNDAKPGEVLRDVMLAMVGENDLAPHNVVDGLPLDRVLDHGDPQAQAAKREVEQLFEQLGEHDYKNRGNKYISFEEAARKKQIELRKNVPGDDED